MHVLDHTSQEGYVRVSESDGIRYVEYECKENYGYKPEDIVLVGEVMHRGEIIVAYDALSLRMETIRRASQRNGKLYIAICEENNH